MVTSLRKQVSTSTALKNATDCNHNINSTEKRHWLQPQHQQHWKTPLTATTTPTALKNATDCNHNTHHFSNSSQGDPVQLAACQNPRTDLHYGGEAAELNTAANCCSYEKLGHYSLLWTFHIMFSAASAGAGNWQLWLFWPKVVLELAKDMYSPDAWSQARCILVKLGEESTKAIFECECIQINTPGPLVQNPKWGCTCPLGEFMYLVLKFTCMPDESYHRCIRSLFLCLCDVFRVLINSLVRWKSQMLYRNHTFLRILLLFLFCVFF